MKMPEPRGGEPTRMTPPELARAIRAMMRDGQFAPGDRLGTAALAERFGVSRGPVREALRLLESRRLVRNERNRGAFVIDLEDEEALDTFAIREVLFAQLAERSAERASEDDLRAMQQALEELVALHRDGRPTPQQFLKETFRVVQVFHRAAASPRLSELIGDLTEGVAAVYGHLAMATRDMRATELRGYQLLVKAIGERDSARAFALARQLHAKGVERARELHGLTGSFRSVA